MSRKIRADSVLDNLPSDQRDQVEAWLIEDNLKYAEARIKVKEAFGVVASLSSLCAFRQRSVQRRLLDRIERSASAANAVKKDLTVSAPLLSQSAIQMAGQIAFEMASAGSFDVSELTSLLQIILKAEAQQTTKEQLALDREKFEFDASKRALACLPDLKAISNDSTLDEPAKILAVRQRLFGVTPA